MTRRIIIGGKNSKIQFTFREVFKKFVPALRTNKVCFLFFIRKPTLDQQST